MENVPNTVEITLADAARINVFSKAESSFSDLGPLKMEMYASKENPLEKVKLLLLAKLNTMITTMGRYNTANTIAR